MKTLCRFVQDKQVRLLHCGLVSWSQLVYIKCKLNSTFSRVERQHEQSRGRTSADFRLPAPAESHFNQSSNRKQRLLKVLPLLCSCSRWLIWAEHVLELENVCSTWTKVHLDFTFLLLSFSEGHIWYVAASLSAVALCARPSTWSLRSISHHIEILSKSQFHLDEPSSCSSSSQKDLRSIWDSGLHTHFLLRRLRLHHLLWRIMNNALSAAVCRGNTLTANSHR